jgi:nicotinamide riboside kinase
VRRISLTGPESTGKSTLAAQLAAHYGTVFVPEVARTYLEENGPQYTLADLEVIAHGQLDAEEAAATHANQLLFCDTDLLVIKIWAENALTLLLGIDLPWEADPLREHPEPAQRQHFYDLYRAELQARRWPFVEVSGSPVQRLAQACAAIDAVR